MDPAKVARNDDQYIFDILKKCSIMEKNKDR